MPKREVMAALKPTGQPVTAVAYGPLLEPADG